MGGVCATTACGAVGTFLGAAGVCATAVREAKATTARENEVEICIMYPLENIFKKYYAMQRNFGNRMVNMPKNLFIALMRPEAFRLKRNQRWQMSNALRGSSVNNRRRH
jgi:hypothetical protein